MKSSSVSERSGVDVIMDAERLERECVGCKKCLPPQSGKSEGFTKNQGKKEEK